MSAQDEYVINGNGEQSNANNNKMPLGGGGEPPKDPYLGLKIFIIIVVSIAVVTVICCAFLSPVGMFGAEPTLKPVVATAMPEPTATLKPTATPKPTVTPKPTETPSAHVKNPVYNTYVDPVTGIKIPYPSHFSVSGMMDGERSSAIFVTYNSDIVDSAKMLLYNPYSGSELRFVACNSDESVMVWSTLLKQSDTDFSAAGDYMRWIKKNESPEGTDINMVDGSAGEDYYYVGIEIGDYIHYRYCKNRNGYFYTIDLLYPAEMEYLYAPEDEEGYHFDLYDRFLNWNFK